MGYDVGNLGQFEVRHVVGVAAGQTVGLAQRVGQTVVEIAYDVVALQQVGLKLFGLLAGYLECGLRLLGLLSDSGVLLFGV